MAERTTEEMPVMDEDRPTIREVLWGQSIKPVAGGSDDDDDADYQGADGHDDAGPDDEDLSNQDPDSDG